MTAQPDTILAIWTVYEHPCDHPTEYVARRFDVRRSCAMASNELLSAPTLDLLRQDLAGMGLVRISRAEGDPAHIVESWL